MDVITDTYTHIISGRNEKKKYYAPHGYYERKINQGYHKIRLSNKIMTVIKKR